MSNRAQITIAVGGVALGGLVMVKVPPELVLSLIGAGALPVLGGAAAYASSARFRDYVAEAGDELDRLLNAPSRKRRKQLPAITHEEAEAMLAGFLNDQTSEPVQRVATGRLVRQAPAQTLQAASQVQAAEPVYHELLSGPRVTITYHPALLDRWQTHVQASGLASANRLAGELDLAAVTLAETLGAAQVRVAAEGGHEHGPALAFAITGGALTPAQIALLNEWGTWWQPYQSGRVEGALVLLASPSRAAVTQVLPRKGSVVQNPTTPVRQVPLTPDELPEYEEPEPELAEEAELPVVEFATRLGHGPDLAPPPAMRPAIKPLSVQGPRKPQSLAPLARIVGDHRVPTVEITFGYNRRGEWVYAPMKHGGVFKGTGGGKTNLLDLVMGQLQALGEVDVWYGTAKPFVPIDGSDSLDRRPLIDRLPTDQVARRPDDILGWIWRAAQHIRDTYDQMGANPGWFPRPTVIIFDEVKSYFDQIGKQKAKLGEQLVPIAELVEQQLRYLLVTAREAGGSVLFTSQDGYCGSINLTRGELGNLGVRAVHPGLDKNSLANVLPEGVPPMLNAGKWDWLCATADGVELVTVPRVSREMFDVWGLLAENTPDPVQGSVVQNPGEPEPAPDPDDATLLRWVIVEGNGGAKITVASAAAHFGVTEAAMRAQMVRNGLVKG